MSSIVVSRAGLRLSERSVRGRPSKSYEGEKLIDQEKIREATASIIRAIGEDPEREGLAETPRRVAQMYAEVFSGLDEDPVKVLATGFDEAHKEMVVVKDILFHSTCEHHFLPFFGKADIGYVPGDRIVGASKLARALDILARRPQLQERLTKQLADAIDVALRPKGLGVIISAEHMCMSIRGARKPGSKILTTVRKGTFRTCDATMREFYSLIMDT